MEKSKELALSIDTTAFMQVSIETRLRCLKDKAIKVNEPHFAEEVQREIGWLTWLCDPAGVLDGAAVELERHTATCILSPDKRLYTEDDMLAMFKAGAAWIAAQGESLQITPETEWSEVDSFVHRGCDGAEVIQIRKK